MKRLLILPLFLLASCDEGVDSKKIESSKIEFYDVRDGAVNLRCAWFSGSGEGSGSIFCYVVQK